MVSSLSAHGYLMEIPLAKERQRNWNVRLSKPPTLSKVTFWLTLRVSIRKVCNIVCQFQSDIEFGEMDPSCQFCLDLKGSDNQSPVSNHEKKKRIKRSGRKRLMESSPFAGMPIHRPSSVPLALHPSLPFPFAFTPPRPFLPFLASAVAYKVLQ